jgi:KEOPS complex subunit Cgi121
MRLVEGVLHVGADADPPAGVPRFADVDELVAELDAIADAQGVTVQAFDARLVVDREHLIRAVELADRARDRGEAIARDRAVEILLYAAGRRQIDRALGMGVGEGATPAVVLVDAEDDAGAASGNGEAGAADAVRDLLDPTGTLGDYDERRVREFFDVGEAELAATDAGLPALVRERVALLVVER